MEVQRKRAEKTQIQTRQKDMNAIKNGLEKPTLDRREGKWREGRGEHKREGFHLINDDS